MSRITSILINVTTSANYYKLYRNFILLYVELRYLNHEMFCPHQSFTTYCSVPSLYLNQCGFIVTRIFGNILQLNLKQNTNITELELANTICEMAFPTTRLQCIDWYTAKPHADLFLPSLGIKMHYYYSALLNNIIYVGMILILWHVIWISITPCGHLLVASKPA